MPSFTFLHKAWLIFVADHTLKNHTAEPKNPADLYLSSESEPSKINF